jgi:CIC family chloride channel protein
MFREGKGELTLASVLSKQSLPSLYPDLPLDSALRYVNDYPLIPVVNRADSHRLEGVISRDSVFKKYGSSRAGELKSS